MLTNLFVTCAAAGDIAWGSLEVVHQKAPGWKWVFSELFTDSTESFIKDLHMQRIGLHCRMDKSSSKLVVCTLIVPEVSFCDCAGVIVSKVSPDLSFSTHLHLLLPKVQQSTRYAQTVRERDMYQTRLVSKNYFEKFPLLNVQRFVILDVDLKNSIEFDYSLWILVG